MAKKLDNGLESGTVEHGLLRLEGTPTYDAQFFEIAAITVGEGNGWHFDEPVLKDALPLFDRAQCFIDHVAEQSDGQHHSVRDLAGVLTEPQWDDSIRGIRCRLQPLGPAAEILKETGRQMLSEHGSAARVGFSADLSFTRRGKHVDRILKIHSVDLVVDPARGGAFLRALASQKLQTSVTGEAEPLRARFQNSGDGGKADEPADSGLYSYLLDSALSASNLPQAVQKQLRVRFSGTAFDPQVLRNEIAVQQQVISALTAAGTINGPGARIEQMTDERDRLSAAVHDLLGAVRPENLRGVQTERLSGIRELYTLTTGDLDFHGGYHPEQTRLSVSADLPALLKNALNKLIVQRWDELGKSGYRWWERIVTVEHFNSLQTISGILVGEINLLPSVAEGAAYTALGVSDSAETGTWAKYGGYLGLTLEMFERDDTLRLRQFPMKLATAGLRRLSAMVGSVFTESAGTGPLMSDGKPVFDAAHANLGTSALSAESWEAAGSAIYNQPLLVNSGSVAPIQALDARYLIVPRALRLTAQRILYPTMAWEQDITSENLQRGLPGDVITCPEMSDPNDWAAVADPLVAPAVIIGERFGLMPEIYIADNQLNGALFTNDEVRIKARHFLSVFVADYRPLYKSNVVP